MRSDRGNAIVEFVVAGLGLQLCVLFAFQSISSGLDQAAAARTMIQVAIRSMQLGGDATTAYSAVNQAAQTFSITAKDYQLAITGDCTQGFTVRLTSFGKLQSATASC
jgi:hypothetical protein